MAVRTKTAGAARHSAHESGCSAYHPCRPSIESLACLFRCCSTAFSFDTTQEGQEQQCPVKRPAADQAGRDDIEAEQGDDD
jgi:hypothetical protein